MRKNYRKIREELNISNEDYFKMRTTWKNMMARCYNEKAINYNHYSSRNITVSEEWHNFEKFLIDMYNQTYHIDKTLDRIDNNKGYSKENTRWTDMTTQNRNRQDTRIITYKGEEVKLADLLDRFNITDYLERNRVYKRLFFFGWDFDKAISTPSRVTR